MKRTPNLLFLCLLSLSPFLFGQPADLARATLINPVYCQNDSTQSYALYLPSSYDPKTAWPILYVFDPAARAQMAVQKFTTIAEELGYIVVCSNQSQNGPWAPIIKASNALFEDTDNRFHLDQRRIYTYGFSGGSRIASYIALQSDRICGVIGCGAGFPDGIAPQAGLEFDYYGLIGNRDMFYQEMHTLYGQLGEYPIHLHLEIFEGPHQWPPSKKLSEALEFMELQAMKKGIIPTRQALLQKIHDRMEAQLQNSKNPFSKYHHLNKYLGFLHDLMPLDSLQKQRDQLYRQATIQSHYQEKAETRKRELAFQDEIKVGLMEIALTRQFHSPVKKAGWWIQKMKQAEAMQKEIAADSLLSIRCQDYIVRQLISQFQLINNQHPFHTAKHYLDAWIAVRPQAPIPEVYLARILLEEEQEKQAFRALHRAAKKGFYKWDYLQRDTLFRQLPHNRQFEKIRQLMIDNRP